MNMVSGYFLPLYSDVTILTISSGVPLQLPAGQRLMIAVMDRAERKRWTDRVVEEIYDGLLLALN